MALRLDRLSDLILAPHHDGSPLYVSNSAAAVGDTVQVRVRVPQSFATEVRTRSNPDHEPVFTTATLVHTTDGWDWWQAPVVVENPVHGYRFLFALADGSHGWLNAAGYSSTELLDREDFTLLAYPAPRRPCPCYISKSDHSSSLVWPAPIPRVFR